jgi:hypothetical protein
MQKVKKLVIQIYKKRYIVAFLLSVVFYFIFEGMGFYLAHNSGAALIALLVSPGLVALFLPVPELIASVLTIILNMVYYLLLYKLYKKIKAVEK